MSVTTSDGVMILRGSDELVSATRRLFASVRTEFACVARDPDTWVRTRAVNGDRSPFAAWEQVSVRKLYSPAALASEEHRAHLRGLLTRGAEVRITSGALPRETILLDQRIAILAGPTGSAGPEYTVTSSPALVAAVSALFQGVWDTATGFEAYLTDQAPLHLDEPARAILRVLSTGVTDEVAARRLGLSLRTYRRRVAELMAALEAGSRFQAGLRAGELGLSR